MLDIRDLHVSFPEADGGVTEAVRGIDLHMEPGELLGLVGESGCGKTVTSLTVAGLIERKKTIISGEILFDGRDLLRCTREELRHIQGKDICMRLHTDHFGVYGNHRVFRLRDTSRCDADRCVRCQDRPEAI